MHHCVNSSTLLQTSNIDIHKSIYLPSSFMSVIITQVIACATIMCIAVSARFGTACRNQFAHPSPLNKLMLTRLCENVESRGGHISPNLIKLCDWRYVFNGLCPYKAVKCGYLRFPVQGLFVYQCGRLRFSDPNSRMYRVVGVQETYRRHRSYR